MQSFISRNKVTVITAVVVALLTSGTAVAASYLVLGSTNTSSATTILKSTINGSVLSVQNTNTAGGTSARGIAITVPAGRSPITVSSGAGKATGLDSDKLDGLDSTSFARKTSEAWHQVGAAGGTPFGQHCGVICSTRWGNYGSGWGTVAFYKDPLGVVHLKGLARHASTTASFFGCDMVEEIFTLPVGYRPAARGAFATISDNDAARIDVLADGRVLACVPNIDPARGWSLEGITFRVP